MHPGQKLLTFRDAHANLSLYLSTVVGTFKHKHLPPAAVLKGPGQGRTRYLAGSRALAIIGR